MFLLAFDKTVLNPTAWIASTPLALESRPYAPRTLTRVLSELVDWNTVVVVTEAKVVVVGLVVDVVGGAPIDEPIVVAVELVEVVESASVVVLESFGFVWPGGSFPPRGGTLGVRTLRLSTPTWSLGVARINETEPSELYPVGEPISGSVSGGSMLLSASAMIEIPRAMTIASDAARLPLSRVFTVNPFSPNRAPNRNHRPTR